MNWWFWGIGLVVFGYIGYNIFKFMKPYYQIANQGKIFDFFVQEGEQKIAQWKKLKEDLHNGKKDKDKDQV